MTVSQLWHNSQVVRTAPRWPINKQWSWEQAGRRGHCFWDLILEVKTSRAEYGAVAQPQRELTDSLSAEEDPASTFNLFSIRIGFKKRKCSRLNIKRTFTFLCVWLVVYKGSTERLLMVISDDSFLFIVSRRSAAMFEFFLHLWIPTHFTRPLLVWVCVGFPFVCSPLCWVFIGVFWMIVSK